MKVKIKKVIIGLGVIWGLSPVAKAADTESALGIFVEPGLTFEAGSTSVKYPAPFTNSSGTVNGFGLGARIGFHMNEAFFLALDARYAMPQFIDSSVNYDTKAISTNWGPAVGLQMPNVGLRVWGSYILGGELNPESAGNFDFKYQEATGYRVGAGFRLASISLNLEYQQLQYGKANLEQIGSFLPGTTFNNVNLANKAWIMSLSFPVAL